jgi:NitT/TauT family transport system substrate-binding protein
VVKRNDVARKDVELERLKMVLDQNIVTPWVKGERPGRVDPARFDKALDQIGLTFTYKNKPEGRRRLHRPFLARRAERKVN